MPQTPTSPLMAPVHALNLLRAMSTTRYYPEAAAGHPRARPSLQVGWHAGQLARSLLAPFTWGLAALTWPQDYARIFAEVYNAQR